jgi:hypothetical protein
MIALLQRSERRTHDADPPSDRQGAWNLAHLRRLLAQSWKRVVGSQGVLPLDLDHALSPNSGRQPESGEVFSDANPSDDSPAQSS